MGMLSLIARLGINTSGFEAGLRRVESLATRFGENVKRRMGKAFEQVFTSKGGVVAGAAALLGVHQAIEKINDDINTQIETIRKLTREYGLTNEQALKLISTSHKLKIPADQLLQLIRHNERLRRMVSAENPTFSAEGLRNIEQHKQAVDQMKRMVFTFAEKGIAFGVGVLNKVASKIVPGFSERFQRNIQNKDAIELELQKAFKAMRDDKDDKEKPKLDLPKLNVITPSLTDSQRVGAFVGLSPLMMYQNESLRTLKKIEQHAAAIKREANRPGTHDPISF